MSARQTGLSLIELIVFIVIVSVALAGVLSVFDLSASRSADPLVRKQALAVAEAMLEEVLSKDFANPAGGFTPATPGNPTQAERPSFDDVTDYNMAAGWSWTVRSLADVATDIPGLGPYTVTVAVAPLVLGGVAGQQVSVTVTGPTEPVTLNGFRADYG
jgi:MSHA pilin protein MshD